MEKVMKETLLNFYVGEILESSSSSEEDEILLLITTAEKKHKVVNYVQLVTTEYTDERFRQQFRVRRETSQKLQSMFEKSKWYPQNISHGGNMPIGADVQILVFLWFAGNKTVIRDTGERFGIAESTCHKVINAVMNFLNDIAPTLIKFPRTIEEKRQISEEFEQISGFPDVLGCIDGTYLAIRTPAQKIKSTYVNRHDMPSITLQAICDANKMFLDVFTGPSSKIHDARIFKLSFISKELEQLCSEQYHIVGDAAYPLRKWLITPFRNYGQLTNAQKTFNYKLSATRVKIENAFGLLKQRFRQLIRLDFHSVITMSTFAVACCVLHNLCIMHEDHWEEIEIAIDEQYDDNILFADDDIAKRLGEAKRQLLCTHLM